MTSNRRRVFDAGDMVLLQRMQVSILVLIKPKTYQDPMQHAANSLGDLNEICLGCSHD
jgi:hypothetical protein